MITKFQLISVLLIFSLAACAPAATELPVTDPVTTEPVLTEAPTDPSTEQAEEQTNYFEGFPPEYQEITLPPEIIAVLEAGGRVVPLPEDPGPFIDAVSTFASSTATDITPYDLDRVVILTSELENTYIAAPVHPEFFNENFNDNFEQGNLAGFVYDENGAYAGYAEIYMVWLFDDRATLVGSQGEEVILTIENDEFFWTQQEIFKEIPVTVFVEGSCYLCWSLDSRSGCLICK